MTPTLFFTFLLLGIPIGIAWGKSTVAKDVSYFKHWHPDLYR